jgi:hypothetical protein
MKYFEYLIAILLMGFIGWSLHAHAEIAPQSPQDSQKYKELGCAKSGQFMGNIALQKKNLPVADVLNTVNPDYHQVVYFIYGHNYGPYEIFWYTFGYCMKNSFEGKAKV